MSNPRTTALFAAMITSGRYRDSHEMVATIEDMRQRVKEGEDAEEVLHDEGFEPDFVLDIL